MQFEWDEVKNYANIRKHGISFETAKRIFEGPVVTWIDQRKDYGEELHQHRPGRARSVDRGRPYQAEWSHSLDLRPSGVSQGKAGLL